MRVKPLHENITAPIPLGTRVMHRGREATVWGVRYGSADNRETGRIYTLRMESRYPYTRGNVPEHEISLPVPVLVVDRGRV